MKQAFLNNLDFIYLFYGAAFFFLGTACLVLYFREREKKSLPWLALSFFGFVHGLNEWLDLLAVSFLDPQFLMLERDIVLGLSYFFLFEFSRRSWNALKKAQIPLWVYFPFLLLIALDYLKSQCAPCASTSIRYFLGFPAAFGASVVIWNFGQRARAQKKDGFYHVLASLCFLYAISTGLIVPKSHHALSLVFNNASFLDITGIPVQLLRAFLSTCIAFLFVYRATHITVSSGGAERGTVVVKFILVSYIFLYLMFLLFGFRFVAVVEKHEKRYLDKVIMADAKLLKSAVGDVMPFVSQGRGPEYSHYRQLHKRLSELAEISAFSKTLYLVTLRDGRPHFAIGSQTQVFPYHFVPAFGNNVPLSFIMDAFHSKQPTLFSGYEDAEGYAAMTVFIPLVNAKNEAAALLGIDLNAKRIEAEIARIRLYAIFVIMAFLVLLIVGYAFLIAFALRSIELEIQKSNLDKAMVRLKETQAELARSEEVFRGILNNSPSAIFGFDRDLKLIFWNHGAELLYGYAKDEVINEKDPVANQKITDLFSIVQLAPEIEKVFEGQTMLKELTHWTKHGPIEVAMTLFPVQDAGGHILFAIGLTQDISEHKRYEENLAAAHARLQEVLDAATNSAIVGVDLSGVVRVFNTGAERIFGVSADKVVDKENFSRFHLASEIEEYAKEVSQELGHSFHGLKAFLAKMEQPGSVEREWTGVRWDGTQFPSLLNVTALRDTKGEINGLLGIGFDLTHRKRAEKAFLESQQKYKDLVNNVNVGVYANTPGPEGKFLEVNPALLEMFEAGSEEDFMKFKVSDTYQDPSQRKNFSEKIMRQGFVRNEELALKTLKGRPFTASVTAVRKVNENGEAYLFGIIQDITEQKRMEKQLIDERDRLRTIAASIGAGLSLVNRDYEIVWVNEVLENWFGKLGTIQGKKCFETYQFKHSICNGCPTKTAFETGTVQTVEQSVAMRNGKKMDFLLICTPIKNDAGEVVQVLELTLDMTEKKKTIELLQYERALSRNVIDSIGETLMVLDCNKRTIIDVNRHFLLENNVKKEDVVGKKCTDIVTHYCPPCEACEFVEVARGGRVMSTTHVHQKKDGSRFYADVTLAPLKDEKGQIIGVIHLSKDVTDRKKMEDELRRYSENLEILVKDRTKALQRSELMFRKLFESAQDGILIIDFESGKIIDINPYALSLFECTRDALQGYDYRSLPNFVDSKIFEQAHRELHQRVSVYYEDVTLETCPRREVAVELRASLYFVEDKKIIQFNIRDLTERKRLDKIKTEFVSMVSHELRTPLSAIKEGVEIVYDGTQGKVNKSQLECLGIALSNIKRLNRLIGDILDISKIQSNLLRIACVPCNMYEVIDQVYHLVRIEIEKRGMILVTNLERDLPLVSADKDRLTQIIMNLLNNAVKFTREKSRITLTCRRAGDFVECGVQDEGAGIPPEELSRLFGRFVQLDSTLVRRVGGTGLGLYISRNLVEAMGGKIWAESQLGSGSIFRFNIPITKEAL